jgi:hypothetical protein
MDIRRHSETITRERQSHPQAALVEFQQREQFPEDARYVAPVDFIHE